MKMVGIADNIMNLFENGKEKWRTELITCNETLGEVDIKRGIFQDNYFSPLLFLVVLILVSVMLNETDLRYVTRQNQKLNLLFMDDLKQYAKSERELDFLIQTVRIFLDDGDMVFGLDKSAVLVLKWGKDELNRGNRITKWKRYGRG